MKKIFIIVLVLFLFLLNFIFGFSIGKISGNSMYPSFKNGEYFVYLKFYRYFPSLLKRGDVVVYSHIYQDVGKVNFIKRIKCIPGDFLFKSGSLYDCSIRKTSNSFVLNGFFLVGDNKKESLDSRYCFTYGPCKFNEKGYEIYLSELDGKVIFKF